MLVYINDFYPYKNDKVKLVMLKKKIPHVTFQIKVLGQIFLEVKYGRDLLEIFRMLNCNPIARCQCKFCAIKSEDLGSLFIQN